MPWDLLGPASSPPSNVDFSPRPGTMHCQSPSPRSLSSLTAIEVRSTCHLIGCRSEDFNYQISLEPCPHEPSIHYWAHYYLAIIASSTEPKVQSPFAYIWSPKHEHLWFLGKNEKNQNFQFFLFRLIPGHAGVKSGQLRSFKVTKGHSRSNN